MGCQQCWRGANNGLRAVAPELFLFIYNAAIVFILPWLAILWREEGMTGGQLGVLSALRPFICAVGGQLLVGVADTRRWHFPLTIITYIITLAARSSMALATGFVAHLLLIAASEVCQSPFSIMTDAAIALATDEAGYCRKRIMGSLGWGVLAPLSGWVVGRWGVRASIAIYGGLVTIGLVPTVLLPLKELARTRSASTELEGPQQGSSDGTAIKPSLSKTVSGRLARGSATALLLPGGGGSTGSSDDLDSRQHAGQAAVLAIEMFGPAAAEKEAAAAAATGQEGLDFAQRINSKLAQAEAPGFTLRPLITTADEDAEEEAAATATAARAAARAQAAASGAATSPASGEDEDSWSIGAVGSPLQSPAGQPSPLAAQRSRLPPIACPLQTQGVLAGQGPAPPPLTGATPAGVLPAPGSTPMSFRAGPSALARTTSAATTAYYSVRSASSMTANIASSAVGTLAGSLLSPRSGGNGGAAVTGVYRQPSDVASLLSAALATPRTAGTAGTAGAAGLQHQVSSVSQAAAGAGGLQHQASNMSQALNGFDQSILEGSMSDGGFLSPRSISFLPRQSDSGGPSSTAPASPSLEAVKAGLLGLPAVHTVHPPHFLDRSQRGPNGSTHHGSGQPGGSAHHGSGQPGGSAHHGSGQPGGSTHLSGSDRQLSDGSGRKLRRRTSSRYLLSLPGGHETIRSSLLASLVLPGAAAPVPAAAEQQAQLEGDCPKQPLLPEGSVSSSFAMPSGKEALPAVALSIDGGSGGSGGDGAEAAEGDVAGKRKRELSVWGGLKQMLANPHHAAFFATAFLMGIGYGILGFEYLYLKESGAAGILIGIALLASTCGEVPLFSSSGWWLPKLGHELAFNIGMLGFVLRIGLYTLLPLFPSPWCVLPVELLQGLTYAVAYGVGTVHAKSIAPPHLRSSTQSLFFCLYYGVGPGVSGLAGGYIYALMGMRFVFIIGACTLLVGWALVQLALRWATRGERAQQAQAAELAP